MALPVTKQELADWILRRLGAPVINVEIADVQLEDCIDKAVQWYQNWHYDGSHRSYRSIVVTEEMLNGNKRPHQNINAPMYEITGDYRVGDRVMTYNSTGRPDKIWVKVDSEERVVFRQYYTVDSEGTYFVFLDSDIDRYFIYDSEASNHVDSEGAYVLYDSDIHNGPSYIVHSNPNESSATVSLWVDSEGEWIPYDSDTHTYRAYVLSSDAADNPVKPAYVHLGNNVFGLFDSDVHTVLWKYDSDTNGLWVDSDNTYVVYDSDKHAGNDSDYNVAVTKFGATSATAKALLPQQRFSRQFVRPLIYEYVTLSRATFPGITYVDSEGEYVLYDSDKHTTYIFTASDAPLTDPLKTAWILDSDSEYSLYDSDKHTFRVYTAYDSDYYHTAYPDSDSEQSLYVDSEGDWVVFDSDRHTVSWIYVKDLNGEWIDSDSEWVRFDSDKHYTWLRTSRKFVRPTLYTRSNNRPTIFDRSTLRPVRYRKITVPLGIRFKRRDVEQTRREYVWDELWKEETRVLNEPKLDLDYSIAGHVGIPIPEDVISVVKVMRVDSFHMSGMWSYEYQFFLNNFDWFYGNGGGTGGAMTSYYITKSYIDMIDMMMNTTPAIRFSKHRNRLYIDTNWTRVNNNYKSKNFYLMAEVYEVNDPEVYGDVYKDMWLKEYATALAKMQWGSNLKKYTNTELPGGITMDGQSLYNEGKEEAEKLEDELRTTNLEMDSIVIG